MRSGLKIANFTPQAPRALRVFGFDSWHNHTMKRALEVLRWAVVPLSVIACVAIFGVDPGAIAAGFMGGMFLGCMVDFAGGIAFHDQWHEGGYGP